MPGTAPPAPASPPPRRDPPDRVFGNGLSFVCRVGCMDWEREVPQKLVIDFEAETDWRTAVAVDRAVGIVDYDKANTAIKELVETREYRLIETVAEDVSRLLLGQFPCTRVRVKVTKTPLYIPNATSVAVECWRSRADLEP